MTKFRLERGARVQGYLKGPLNGNLDTEGERERELKYFDSEELVGRAEKGDGLRNRTSGL